MLRHCSGLWQITFGSSPSFRVFAISRIGSWLRIVAAFKSVFQDSRSFKVANSPATVNYTFFLSPLPFTLFSTISDFSFDTFGTNVEICSTKKSSAMYKYTLRGYKMKRLLWLPFSSPNPRLLIIAGYCRSRMANFFIISALNCQNDFKKKKKEKTEHGVFH